MLGDNEESLMGAWSPDLQNTTDVNGCKSITQQQQKEIWSQ